MKYVVEIYNFKVIKQYFALEVHKISEKAL